MFYREVRKIEIGIFYSFKWGDILGLEFFWLSRVFFEGLDVLLCIWDILFLSVGDEFRILVENFIELRLKYVFFWERRV